MPPILWLGLAALAFFALSGSGAKVVALRMSGIGDPDTLSVAPSSFAVSFMPQGSSTLAVMGSQPFEFAGVKASGTSAGYSVRYSFGPRPPDAGLTLTGKSGYHQTLTFVLL